MRHIIDESGNDGVELLVGNVSSIEGIEQKLHPTAYDPQVQDRILAVIEASEGPSSPRP